MHTMPHDVEQRSVVKFLVAQGKSQTETFKEIEAVYGEHAMSRSQVRHWWIRFQEGDGHTPVTDHKHTGRPQDDDHAHLKNKIEQLLQEDARLTIRQLARRCQTSYGTVQKIVKNELKMRKLAAKFIPKLLTQEQKDNRVRLATMSLQLLEDDPLFLSKIVTGDESWCFTYDPETKKASAQWVSKEGDCPVKPLRARTTKKLLVTAFFDQTGMVYTHFLCRTMNTKLYCEALTGLRAAIRKKRPFLWDFQEQNPLLRRVWFHQDNARPHVAHKTITTLAESRINLLEHPPYSPDLAPCDFFLFPKLKAHLRGRRFDSVDELQIEIKACLRSIPTEQFQNAFVDLAQRWRKCIAHNGDFFEGQKHPPLPPHRRLD